MTQFINLRAAPIGFLERVAANPEFLKRSAVAELNRRANIYGHHWTHTNRRAKEALERLVT